MRRVLMMLTGSTPFGAEWARAASTVADVMTVDVVDRVNGVPIDAKRDIGVSEPGTFEVARVRIRGGRAGLRRSALTTAGRFERLLRYIEQEAGGVDVLHTHFYANARFVPYLHGTHGISLVHTEHASALTPLAAPHKRASRAGLRYARRSYEAADRVIAVSAYLRTRMHELDLIDDVSIIGNPVDVDRFRPRRAAESPTDRIDVVTVGRLESDKGMDDVLHAFSISASRERRLRLRVVGDGPERAALVRLAAGLGIQDSVTFEGHLPRDQTAAVVGASQVFVSCAKVETFGLAIAEALAAGVPAAAPATGAIPELVDRSRGILVAPDDPAALADAVLRLARSPGMYRPATMATWVRDRFSHAAVGRRLSEVYDAVTAGAVMSAGRPSRRGAPPP